MDEETLRQLLTAQDGVEFAPTAEMMMMNSTAGNDMDASDIELPGFVMQRQPASSALEPMTHSLPPVVTSARTSANNATNNDDDDDSLVEDETILERIIALKEMFPESVQNAVGSLNRGVINLSKLAYTKGRSATWWLTSTMSVLVFPILIQKELLQVAEQISREQRSILLGPQAATGPISGSAF